MEDLYEALPREEVVKAVERKRPVRVPCVMTKWWGEGLWEQYGERLREFDRFPHDAELILIDPVPYDRMSLSWLAGSDTEQRGHDSGSLRLEWAHLDEFIAKLPSPDEPGLLDPIRETIAFHKSHGRYVLFGWWGLFFERPWAIRGMSNILMDYYLNPDDVHRLHEALCDHYSGLIRRAAGELQPDGFWTSDDLGHQTQSMMRRPQFVEFLKPYYVRVAQACHEAGMHFWLHSCGNNTDLLEDLIEAGVDVFHPVQKHTMDERAIAAKYGDRLTFLAGLDVQHVLQEGSPDDVRAEVRYLVDTFDRPNGGMALAAGNGIVAGTPFANIEAFLDEAVRYGYEHRSRFSA
jgi:hypothetical protein